MENDTVSIRLRALRAKAGYSVRAMAALLDIPASTYVNYESRFKKPYLPMDFTKSLATALADKDISEDEVMALAGLEAPERVENSKPAPAKSRLIPVLDVAASAGHGSLVEYEAVAYSLAFPPDYLEKITRSNPRHLRIISVKGDSMEPLLKDDDIVMVDTAKTNPGYDGMFVVIHSGVLKVKQLRPSPDRQTISLISANRAVYPPEDCEAQDVEIIGRVIWVGGKV